MFEGRPLIDRSLLGGGGGGKGYSFTCAIEVCAATKGVVFELFLVIYRVSILAYFGHK